MKKFMWFFLVVLFFGFTTSVSAGSDGPNAYMTKDEYCIEVGWDEASQEYFNTHLVECKFINVLVNDTYVLNMHAQIPEVGDICHEIDESTSPPSFKDVPCEYTVDDWVAAGSPKEYVIEGQTCLANFLFMLNLELGFDDLVWGINPIVTFTDSGNIKSSCIGQ